mmetsp:Transcript_29242/g.77275  ORF Transcript_29242/g.77275 Transcript_29242/m.77275 type:complete len:278 (+) Transcript_29242:1257-2090(+)
MAFEVVQANGHDGDTQLVFFECLQRDVGDASLQRQQICAVMATTFWEDTETLAVAESGVHFVVHGPVVDPWEHRELCGNVAGLRLGCQSQLTWTVDLLHSKRGGQTLDFQRVARHDYPVEVGALPEDFVGSVRSQEAFALFREVLRARDWNAAKCSCERAHDSLVPRFLRDHEGDFPVTVPKQHHAINELVVVVACEDDRAPLGKILHTDNLTRSEEHVVDSGTEKELATVIQEVLRLINDQPQQDCHGQERHETRADPAGDIGTQQLDGVHAVLGQ